LTVILQHEETRDRRVVINTGRCLSVSGHSIPWFRITRQMLVAAIASLCREIAQRSAYLEGIES
jgi:hypothetical protein